MNQKGLAKIVLIVLIIVLAGALGYVTLVKKPTLTEQTRTTTPLPTNNNTSQTSPVDTSVPLTVLSPNGGEKWYRGKEYSIKWSSNLPTSAPIHIALRKSPTLSKDVYKEFDPETAHPQAERFADSIYPNPLSNSGSYIYKVPSDIPPGDDWQVMIWSGQACSVWNPEKKCDFDLSDNLFSIQ